ncbi:MarR family winged helix-turn-helix transcriptional regulator [Blastococcus goldschmidtiae]|uniref:MarR family winged helix-turn-helix transcriptional regulator n=1 Tax=Blastococcus goldschmidtiae TaxID=3075546 RepID=A0ABU2K3L1_9ACTN|nr:MarR family winged helix-turn-helix transcriptional regulator [Blastococcus sp. DSM 46792]MDT0274760.1 MarR family winged helix-turn-helix transcriptional regulator [Blastococcus sp. DSM 46792]
MQPREVVVLSEQLPRFMRLANVLKSQLAGPEGHDRAALVLLYPLTRLGPLRQGALADELRADPSTVSRHVAVLVGEGLARRVADPADGRATRLVVTDAGLAALAAMRREQTAMLSRITADWDEADLTVFTGLFNRFLDDFAAALPADAAPSTPTPGDLR